MNLRQVRMELDAFLHLVSSGDPAKRAMAARDLGRHLARPRAEVVALRRALAELAVPDDPDVRGFVDACAMIARGFEAEREAASADAELRDAVHHRKYWKETLVAIADGLDRPTKLEQHLEIDAAQVTSILKALEAADLVFRPSPGHLADGRTRPCQLSARGHALVRELDRITVASGTQIAELVDVIAECAMMLLVDGAGARGEVESILASALEPELAATTLAHLERALPDELAAEPPVIAHVAAAAAPAPRARVAKPR